VIAPDVPAADEVTGPWWEATGAHRFLVQTCESCGSAQHPPRALCIRCGQVDGLGWAEAAGTATVDSYTVVHRAPRPGLELPYVVARVRLTEGVIALTRLEGRDPEQWRIGDPVRVGWVDLADGRALPVFSPDDAS
jgi:uncharacterized protein